MSSYRNVFRAMALGTTQASMFMLMVGAAMAAETNLALSDTANFFDAGLTALGLLTALVTTVMRGRLDAENNTRDLLTYIVGKELRSVKMLDGSHGAQRHSLSTALLIVEEKGVVWARELYSYYGATSTKPIDLMTARWLHPDNYPQGVERCKCSTECKCLLLQRVLGVTEHVIALAKGAIFKVNDEFDAIICAGCRHNKCHGSFTRAYQGLVSGPLGSPTSDNASDALILSVADLYVKEEGNTGLIMLDPGDEQSVKWASTILEASVSKDAEERGSENPFTISYSKALVGEESHSLFREEYADSSLWLSRAGAFLLASTLVVLFRTDPFSSVLLARRALRGYMLDGTGTKLPLQTFCSLAHCTSVPEERRALVVLKPKQGFILRFPSRILWLGAMLEAIVLVLWVAALAITPWVHPVGSSYLKPMPLWASVLCAAFVSLASSLNIVYYWQALKARKWMICTAACAIVDAAIICLTILLGVGVARGHWIVTIFRALMMWAALLQWYLGVEHLGAGTATFRGGGTLKIVPYALTYGRLLALVAGGGNWA